MPVLTSQQTPEQTPQQISREPELPPPSAGTSSAGLSLGRVLPGPDPWHPGQETGLGCVLPMLLLQQGTVSARRTPWIDALFINNHPKVFREAEIRQGLQRAAAPRACP